MTKEMASTGFYEPKLWQQKYPRLQILSIEDLLRGETIKIPPPYSAFKKAQRVQKKDGINQWILNLITEENGKVNYLL